jgi:hypothetical protein
MVLVNKRRVVMTDLDGIPILHVEGLGRVRLVDAGPVEREADSLNSWQV